MRHVQLQMNLVKDLHLPTGQALNDAWQWFLKVPFFT